MMTITDAQSIFERDSRVRSITLRVDGFTYGGVHELEQRNVWTVRARGLVIVCAVGLRPADEGAVCLGVDMSRSDLRDELLCTAWAAQQLDLPKGIALLLVAMQPEWSDNELVVHRMLSFATPDAVPMSGSDDKLFVPVVSIAHWEAQRAAQAVVDKAAVEGAPDDVYVPMDLTGHGISGVDMKKSALAAVFADTVRAVIVTGPAAGAVLNVAHDEVDTLTIMIDDGALFYPALKSMMYHLAVAIQRSKVSQWIIGLRREGLVPLVSELWNNKVHFSVYVADCAVETGLRVCKLAFDGATAAAWLDANEGEE
jgi:hypothetical protein